MYQLYTLYICSIFNTSNISIIYICGNVILTYAKTEGVPPNGGLEKGDPQNIPETIQV